MKRKMKRTGVRKGNTSSSSTRQHQASHKCSSNKRSNSTLGFYPVLPRPPYTPDLAPNDFHLFQKLKEHLKGQYFSCDEELESTARTWLQEQNAASLEDGCQELVVRCCTEVCGEFCRNIIISFENKWCNYFSFFFLLIEISSSVHLLFPLRKSLSTLARMCLCVF